MSDGVEEFYQSLEEEIQAEWKRQQAQSDKPLSKVRCSGCGKFGHHGSEHAGWHPDDERW